jgi:hypothetical protein
MPKHFVDLLKDYKEILGAIAAVIAGAFFVVDYFATKIEMSVLQCQTQNNISLVDSKMKSDQVARQIVSLKSQPTAPPDPARQTEIELQIDRLRRDLASFDEDQKAAARNLMPGACEKIVRGK